MELREVIDNYARQYSVMTEYLTVFLSVRLSELACQSKSLMIPAVYVVTLTFVIVFEGRCQTQNAKKGNDFNRLILSQTNAQH